MNTGFVNNIIIAGFLGGGKIFVMMYIVIYSRSKGLTVITFSMMCHRAIQLVGCHWNKLLCIPVYRSNKISVYQMTELAIKKLEHFPNIIEFIWSIRMIYNDKIGQTPEEFDHVIDNIFKVVCGMNVHKGKYILLQHTNQHNSNLFEDIRLWCPLVLFHVKKLFLSKILSAHKMIIFQDSIN